MQKRYLRLTTNIGIIVGKVLHYGHIWKELVVFAEKFINKPLPSGRRRVLQFSWSGLVICFQLKVPSHLY